MVQWCPRQARSVRESLELCSRVTYGRSFAARRPRLPCPGAQFASAGGLRASILHAGLVRGDALGLLPMRSQQPNSLDRIKAGVIHPMVRLAHERQIVGIVVAGVVIKMRDREARRKL